MATTKTKRKQIEQTEAKTILDSVKDIQIGDVVTQVNTLQISVQKTLADLCSTVTTKVKQVEDIDTAIELKNERLKELFGIENEAFSLEEMRAQREQEKLDWDLERQVRQNKWQEEEAEHTKNRNRNEDNWKYDFEQSKKKTLDLFNAEVERAKTNEKLRHESLERSWVDREATLKTKEQEYAAMKAQIDGFDAKVEAAVKQAEARSAAIVTSKFNHEIALLKKDSESQKAVADLRIVSLNEAIDSLHSQIENLSSQLISARQDAKEVASQALQSASNRGVADALQRVVDGQQNTNVKTK
jgi:colicin import membrane protein